MKKVNNVMEALEIGGDWAVLDISSIRKFDYGGQRISLNDIVTLYKQGWELVTVDGLNYQYFFKKRK